MTIKVTTYKDHDIELSGEKFTSAGFGYFEKCADLKAAIDDSLRVKYQPVKGLVYGRHRRDSGFAECEVQRPHSKGYGPQSYWIKMDGKRSTASEVYADTPANRALIAEMIEQRRLARQHDAKADKLNEMLTAPELIALKTGK